MSDFFNLSLNERDESIANFIKYEYERQRDGIELIASENYVSRAVMEAQGSVLTNKYAEGYPYKRYYGGCRYIDMVEQFAIERAKRLFACEYVNVQPHSGSQANQAVFLALLQPGDTILGLRLDQGGHLTHGSPVNMSGKWFNAEFYGVNENGFIDYDVLREKALQIKPKMITAGASAYPREIDFERIGDIAREVGAYFMADIAHIAGLVATEMHQSPLPYADVVTTTTHKTLRGPRGGMIMTNNKDIAKKIDSAVFPGLQGGPLEHVIAAKAVAFGEALSQDYAKYIQNVIANCKALGETISNDTPFTLDLVSGGTDNHLLLIDLRKCCLTGDIAEQKLEEAGLTVNKNMIPFDTESPKTTSGIRVGTAAGTTRGFTENDFRQIGKWILEVLYSVGESHEEETIKNVRAQVKALCDKYPIYQ